MAADDQRAEALQSLELVLPLFQALGPLQREHAVLGNHVEQRDVDGVHAFAEDAALTAFLPAVGEKLPRVLEVVALDDPGQGLRRHELVAAAREDVADLPLLDGDQRELVDRVLPPPKSEVDAAAENVGLVARLAVEGNDRAFGQRAAGRPQLLHDADAVVGDVPDGEPQQEQQQEQHNANNKCCRNHGRSFFQWECARITRKYSICTGKRRVA